MYLDPTDSNKGIQLLKESHPRKLEGLNLAPKTRYKQTDQQ